MSAVLYEGPRDVDGPPHREADLIASTLPPDARFVIVRRGPLCVMRYDATEWIAHKAPQHPRTLHDRVGDHPCLNRVGFGFTRRAALRSMRRCEASAIGMDE